MPSICSGGIYLYRIRTVSPNWRENGPVVPLSRLETKAGFLPTALRRRTCKRTPPPPRKGPCHYWKR
jgi:hypothetical protein